MRVIRSAAYQKVEEPADSSTETSDGSAELHGCHLASIQEGNSNEAKSIDDEVEVPVARSELSSVMRSGNTNRKNTAALDSVAWPDDTRPVTHARHTDIAAALNIIRARLPNLSTVNAQMMPPRMMHP